MYLIAVFLLLFKLYLNFSFFCQGKATKEKFSRGETGKENFDVEQKQEIFHRNANTYCSAVLILYWTCY